MGLDDDELGSFSVSAARGTRDDMRGCSKIEILRLRTAALTCIFNRTFSYHLPLEVKVQVVLEELSCAVFLADVLRGCSSWCTLPCLSQRDVHLIPWSYQAIFTRKSLASARPCLIPSLNLSTWCTRPHGTVLPSANFITSP